MAKVRCFSLDGITLWYNSHDHLPPHFHAENEPGRGSKRWEVRVEFLKGPPVIEVLSRSGAPGSRILKKLCSLVVDNRLELFEEWEQAVCVRDPGPKE